MESDLIRSFCRDRSGDTSQNYEPASIVAFRDPHGHRCDDLESKGASGVESRFEALRTATTPLVGRDEEMALLMRRWEQAKSGDGCIVLISGEPGIGKSRLAEALQESLGTEPHRRVRFFCSPYHQDSALYPAIAQLERAAGFRREDNAEQRLTKLEALLAQATNDVTGGRAG